MKSRAATRLSRILLIDDSEIVRDLVSQVLKRHGYEVTARSTPFGFSKALSDLKPDLVLIDVSMPALQGDQLVKVALQYRLHRCPLVLFSSRSDSELAELVRASGASGYIRKTEDPRHLVSQIQRLLASESA